MDNANGWTMSDEAADEWFSSEHPRCEHCSAPCCIRPDACNICRDEDIGVAVGPDKLHVHVGCKDAFEVECMVDCVADGIRVLNGPLYGFAIPEAAIRERARNVVTALRVGL